jgi:hypothetical protein
MKKILVIFFSLIIIASCGSRHKKAIHGPISSPKYISVVENTDGFSSAYTEDGHTLIYKTDSNSNVVVYYAKFDDNAGKKGYDRVRDKAIRVEIDSSLNVIKSFVSVHGGALCKINSNGIYTLHYFDEQRNDNNIELPEYPLEKQTIDKRNIESKVKRIIEILTTAYNIANNINGSNKGGWNYIVSALEPMQSIISYDIMTQETVYSPNVKEHIWKLNSTTKGLTQLRTLFLEKENEALGQ